MKAFLLCTCILVLASFSLADIKQQLKKAMSPFEQAARICATENNWTRDDWFEESEITTNFYLQPENEQRTRKCGCTIACVMKKRNIMEGSDIKVAKLHEAIDEVIVENPHSSEIPQLHKITNDCTKEVKDITDECEKAFSLYICMVKAIMKIQQESLTHTHNAQNVVSNSNLLVERIG